MVIKILSKNYNYGLSIQQLLTMKLYTLYPRKYVFRCKKVKLLWLKENVWVYFLEREDMNQHKFRLIVNKKKNLILCKLLSYFVSMHEKQQLSYSILIQYLFAGSIDVLSNLLLYATARAYIIAFIYLSFFQTMLLNKKGKLHSD